MKLTIIMYLLSIAFIISSCSFGRHKQEGLPFIDVRKEYPEKELTLTDFADVTYINLNSDNENYLYKSILFRYCITENTFVMYDNSSFSILFFSKEGTPKSRFNRNGQGPEDYWGLTRLLYDEESDDLYVINDQAPYIQVYSSIGDYKRKIPLPQQKLVTKSNVKITQQVELSTLVSYDNLSFLAYWDNHSTVLNKTYGFPAYTTYYRISKENGEILNSFNLPRNDIPLAVSDNAGGSIMGFPVRLIKSIDGFLLCNPESDTVFLYARDHSISPVFHKIPSIANLDPMMYISIIADVSRYQFFTIKKIPKTHYSTDVYPVAYFRDKETNEIFRQNIILPEYQGEKFNITAILPTNAVGDTNGYVFNLDLTVLKKANTENRLSGKLKEMVDKLNELEDNNIFMIVRFK